MIIMDSQRIERLLYFTKYMVCGVKGYRFIQRISIILGNYFIYKMYMNMKFTQGIFIIRSYFASQIYGICNYNCGFTQKYSYYIRRSRFNLQNMRYDVIIIDLFKQFLF